MFKKILKWLGIILMVIVIGLAVTVAARQNVKYEAPYPEVHASTDSAVLARGKYLVFGPAHCADCHAPIGTEAQVDKGEEVPLSGGKVFELPVGNVYVRNITPDETGIGKLTDQQIARSLRYGVGHDGRAMIDFMPFHNTSDADLTAIISYLRTTKAVKNEVPMHTFNLLGMIIKALVLKPVGPDGEVAKSVTPDSSAAYGKYLATSVANCRGCHTERDLKTGAFIGADYAGGLEIQSEIDKKYFFHTPNISPDQKTGHIYDWSEEMFLARFRKGKLIPESPMPWGPFGRMTDAEIKAIYRYLKTVTPVERKIDQIVIIKK